MDLLKFGALKVKIQLISSDFQEYANHVSHLDSI